MWSWNPSKETKSYNTFTPPQWYPESSNIKHHTSYMPAFQPDVIDALMTRISGRDDLTDAQKSSVRETLRLLLPQWGAPTYGESKAKGYATPIDEVVETFIEHMKTAEGVTDFFKQINIVTP